MSYSNGLSSRAQGGQHNGFAGGQADLQEKIAMARRQADLLKDQIRQKKDETADTSREYNL